MFKKSMLFALALLSLAAVTGCSLPSWLGGGSKPAAAEKAKK